MAKTLTEAQRGHLKALALVRDRRMRQERTLRATRAELDQLVTAAITVGAPPSKVAKAAGLTPSRIWQIRKDKASG
jgi:formaldehyde-activating enzyme involved in methanogenesis